MMDLYNLGPVGWVESQSIYHALASLGREGLIICRPDSPYVCLGLHDDLHYEIDREYCQYEGIPLLRRETGGGVVYLDQGQIFYQLVIRQDNSLLPLNRTKLYPRFLQPAISLYRRLGLPAELKAPADISAGGRKCSGNACGDIGQCVAYVGNILVDFDFQIMSRVLQVPGEAFRCCLKKTMLDNMTTLGQWCPQVPDYNSLANILITSFEQEFGNFHQRRLDRELASTALRVGQRLTSEKWLQMPGRRPAERKIKVAEGVYLSERTSYSGEKRMMSVVDGVEEEIGA